MRERSSRNKRPRDLNQLAASIVEEATSDEPPKESSAPEKNPHAAALGRLGGKKGGRARAEKLTAARRSEIARKAAEMRWQRQREDARKGGG
jgi:hypothetical protein